MNTKRRSVVWPAVIGLAAALILLVIIGYIMERSTGTSSRNDTSRTVEDILDPDGKRGKPVYFNGKQYRWNQDVEAYLFMGIDRTGEAQSSGSYNGGGQADVLLLLVVDQERESFRVLQINRDAMAEVEILGVRGDVIGTEYKQIALAHFYGNGLEKSCENTVRAVSNLLYGVYIDGYAAIQMEAVPILNDMVGGVTVTIEDDFSQVDDSLIQGETITLQGEQAMHFIRSRMNMGDSSNLARMDRHRAYLHGFDEAFTAAAKQDVELVLNMYDAAHDYLVTDMGSGLISRLAQRCLGYTNGGVITMEGEVRLGETFMEFYPDENSLRQKVLDLFYIEADTD